MSIRKMEGNLPALDIIPQAYCHGNLRDKALLRDY